ncbi:hypothetical protein QDP87_04790 [Enterobacter hormaechei]|uniref:hypothetical protein n=1 Tax=Enterobacter hormaechei TaxID=158836 RepID=UPI00335AD92A
MITEKNNVFYCDCGFSFLRGHSGAHDCAVGLRNKLAKSEARCAALAAENAGLKAEHELALQYMDELRANFTMYKKFKCHFQSDVTTPATDAFLAEVRAQGLERLAKAWYAIANDTSSGISISESSRLKYRQRADDVADFANEIRQEAAQ